MNSSTSQLSPLSPTLWPARAFIWPRSLALFTLLVIAFFAGAVLAVITANLLGSPLRAMVGHPHLTWGVVVGQLMSYVPIVAVLFLMPWLSARSFTQLGFARPTLRLVLYGLAGAVAMFVASVAAEGVQQAVTHRTVTEDAVKLFTSSHDRSLLLAFAALAALVAPFIEEFVFRGFLFNAILRYTPAPLAIALSSLAFGAAHISDPAATALVPLACAGAVLAYLYWKTGSLAAAIIAHAAFNASQTAALFAAQSAGAHATIGTAKIAALLSLVR